VDAVLTDRPENTISPALEPEICIVIRDPDGGLLDVNKFAIVAEPINDTKDRARDIGAPFFQTAGCELTAQS
jgi:uncharacterized protein (DUF2141 family)